MFNQKFFSDFYSKNSNSSKKQQNSQNKFKYKITASTSITVDNHTVLVNFKNIKNLYLRINSNKKITVSAPKQTKIKSIEDFIKNKRKWLDYHVARAIVKPPTRYLDGNTIYYLGEPCRLQVITPLQYPAKTKYSFYQGSKDTLPFDHDEENKLVITLPRTYTTLEEQEIAVEKFLYQWYRNKLNEILTPLIKKWEIKMNLQAKQYLLKKMYTRWGSCNPTAQRIWLSVELIKKPLPCIECVLVHELVHLLERSHNHRFKYLMTYYLPEWKKLQTLLQGNID